MNKEKHLEMIKDVQEQVLELKSSINKIGKEQPSMKTIVASNLAILVTNLAILVILKSMLEVMLDV